MSNIEFSLAAKSRADVGKGASRRLRRLNKEVPAIIYGGGKDPASITLRHDDIMHAVENEAFFSHILEIDVDGTKENVIIKDLQRHPARPIIMHADFQRVRADQALHVNVPLHFLNEEACVGVKLEGGQISIQLHELEISCLPKDLPEYIAVDMLDMHVGDSIHIADLKLPEGVTSISLDHHGEEGNLAVAQVTKMKVQEEEPAAGAEAAEPKAEEAGESSESKED